MKRFGSIWNEVGSFFRRGVIDRSKIRALWLQNYQQQSGRWMNRERFFWEWFTQFRKQLHNRSRRIVLSATLLAAFDWDKERIEFDSVKAELKEFEFVEKLKKRTFCFACSKKILIGSTKLAGVEYCTCDRKKLEVLQLKEQHVKLDDDEGWEPYIECNKMITWRREERPGLYAYKVYVEYPDVSAEDFLFVQTDIGYRRQWDETAIVLKVIDTEQKSDSQIIYWEMLWPKLFSNRDYVYNRRYFIDPETKMFIIVNRSISHPKCPPCSNKQRVREYWSNMVVKPKTDFTKPGLEFVLTYFDDPGLSIPKSITTWVAQRQMPDFLEKMHQATLSYANDKKMKEMKRRNIWRRDPGFEYPNLEHEDLDKENDGDEPDDESTTSDPADPEQDDGGGGWFSWWFIKKLLLLN